MKRFNLSSPGIVPAALLAVVTLAYGVFIPWFGLYGDDWIYLHNFHRLGAWSFNQFVAADRPFSGWVYVLVSPLFGEAAWPYHLFLLVLRWISALEIAWIVRLIWPGRNREAFWVAALFAVYPGFQQHPIAVQYILHFSVLNLFLASVGLMLLAVLRPARFKWFYGLAIAASLVIFSMEYFAGLELLRPVLLWMVLARTGLAGWKRVRRAALLWAPFLLVVLAFGYWRAVIFKFPTYGPALLEGLAENPLSALTNLLRRVLTDLVNVNAVAWRQTLILPGEDGSLLFFAALVLGVFALMWFVHQRMTAVDKAAVVENEQPARLSWPVQAIGLGLFSMLAAGWPFWFAGVPLELSFPWDRSTLPFMFGACLALVGGLELLIQPAFRGVLLALLVGLSAGSQYRNALIYRGERDALNRYFWQLAWRAPSLQPGAIVASDSIPLFRFSDNDLTPILDWMYAPDGRTLQMEYKYFDLSLRLGSNIESVETDLPVSHSYRGFYFEGNTNGLLAVYNRPDGCLHILSPQDSFHPGLPETVQKVLPISNPSVIQLDGDHPASPPAALGPEPAHDWCYYYEKGALAHQFGRWQEAAQLGDEAFGLGLEAGEPFELLPFVESYARAANYQRALELSRAVQADERLKPGLCQAWTNVSTSLASKSEAMPEQQAAVESALDDFGCR